MTEIQNSKHITDLKEQTSTFGSLDIGIWDLFVIWCLGIVFLSQNAQE